MKIRCMLALGLVSFAGAASAGSDDDIRAMAVDAGLTDREMRMIMGAPSSYAEYRTSYASARAKLRRLYAMDRTPMPEEIEREERVDRMAPAVIESERAPAEEAETFEYRDGE
jgi:hypothetical protein